MSRTHIPIADRRLVRDRAEGRCEYCLIHEEDTAFGSDDTEFGCHFDHIIAEKHGGKTGSSGNLVKPVRYRVK